MSHGVEWEMAMCLIKEGGLERVRDEASSAGYL